MIGAGPGGLVAARWLLSQGTSQRSSSRVRRRRSVDGVRRISGIGRACTPTPAGSSPPSATLSTRAIRSSRRPRIRTYLHRYAKTFALTSRIRLGTRVELLSRGESGWLDEHSGTTETFERVVVASGRFQSPCIRTVPGLTASPARRGGSTYNYRQALPSLGKRALVAGGAISGPRDRCRARAARRGAHRDNRAPQRYVLPKSPRECRPTFGSSRDTEPSPTKLCRQQRSIGSSRRSWSKQVEARNSTARLRPIRRCSLPASPWPSSTCHLRRKAESQFGRG